MSFLWVIYFKKGAEGVIVLKGRFKFCVGENTGEIETENMEETLRLLEVLLHLTGSNSDLKYDITRL